MKRIAMAALVAAGLGLLPAAAQAQRNGVYDVNGVNPDGTAYNGVMVLQQVGLASWRIAWQVGESRIEGYAMSAGLTFSIGFVLGDRPGISIYQVYPDGSMTGQWTLMGSSAIGTETLTPRPAGPPPAAAPSLNPALNPPPSPAR